MHAAKEPVDVGKSLGALQRMVEGVSGQAGYLGNEFPHRESRACEVQIGLVP